MQRTQFYASKAYVQQLRVGVSYGDLEKVVFLGILDFIEFPDIDRCHTKHIVVESKWSFLYIIVYHASRLLANRAGLKILVIFIFLAS